LPTSANKLLRLLADNANAPFEKARSLPPAIYHSPEILKLEIEKIFRSEWICLGRTAEIPKAGDYICRDIIDTPVFAIRQKDKSIKAFSNVCLHRSACLLAGDGHVSRISCPYHSWTYELDGQLIGAPFMQETTGFETKNYSLNEFPCEIWEGFVYIALGARPTSIEERLSDLTSLVSGFRMADYVPVFAEEETWDTNWKCLVENFMDVYHLHRVHRNSFSKYGSSEDQTTLFPGGDAFAYHYVQDEEGPRSVQAHPQNTWLKGPDRLRTWLINIFPAHTIQLQPDMLWYLSILPDGLEKTRIRWAVSIPGEILDSAKIKQVHIDEVMALLHQVNSEDRPIVESVSQTTRSPAAVQGPLSYLERNVWDFGRYLHRKLNL
jgi:phenylpropionate dioxygenase-like ring-hydroxylating dioxygenase large terminal subunit